MKRLLIHQLAVLAVVLFMSPVTASAQSAQPATTSLQLPLSGTVSVPLSNGSFEAVALTGRVHVMIPTEPFRLQPTDPIRIHVNLDQVSGVGNVTRLLYVATGANRINVIPDEPFINLNLGFDLRAVAQPVEPITPGEPVMPLDLSLIIFFSVETGEVSASIESISVPAP